MALNALTPELIASLSKGIATTKVLGVTDGKVTFNNLDFSSAGEIFSIEDSLNIDWAEPTLTEVKVDQGQKTIDSKVEQGEITFSANYPTIAEAALAEFFTAGTTEATITGSKIGEAAKSYTGKSIFTSPKTTEVTMLIEDQNQAFAIVMARVSLTARLAFDSDNKLWYIGLNGRVLSNLEAGQGDILVAKATA